MTSLTLFWWVFFVDFEQISQIVLIFPLLNLNEICRNKSFWLLLAQLINYIELLLIIGFLVNIISLISTKWI